MANLQLQGGSIYLEEYNPDGTLQPKIYPGTTDEIKFNTAADTVEHTDTESEEQVFDGQDVIKRNMTISFTTADINDTFNAMAYLASSTNVTQIAQTATQVIIISSLAGKVEELGYMDITSLAVTDVTGTTTYVESVDYTYDRKWGTLIVLSTGSIVDGSEIHVTLDANVVNGKNLTSFATNKREYRLTYQGRSSKGRNEKHVFEKVFITMDGDRVLKSTNRAYTVINFTGAVLKHNGKTHSMVTY